MTVHNRKDTTIECLKCLYANKIPEGYTIDVYLTDDGCTDGTSYAICNLFPDVHIIEGNGNLYWNRGMWTAWSEASKYDYGFYIWLNDDTFVNVNMVESLLELSVKMHNLAIIIGATQSSDGQQITYGGRDSKGNIPPLDGQNHEVSYFNGNIVLIPKSVYYIVGNLDYYFSHSKGDFDYGMRAAKEGVKMIQCGKVLGVCDAHERIDKWCDSGVPFFQRWRAMWKPTGMPPHETFHLNRRHAGLLSGCFYYLVIILRCFFPWIWSIKRKK